MYINNPGHMTKKAAMPIYGEMGKTFKMSFKVKVLQEMDSRTKY